MITEIATVLRLIPKYSCSDTFRKLGGTLESECLNTRFPLFSSIYSLKINNNNEKKYFFLSKHLFLYTQ